MQGRLMRETMCLCSKGRRKCFGEAQHLDFTRANVGGCAPYIAIKSVAPARPLSTFIVEAMHGALTDEPIRWQCCERGALEVPRR